MKAICKVAAWKVHVCKVHPCQVWLMSNATHVIKTAGVDLRKANLKNADLRGCNLENSDLQFVSLAGARLDGANLKNVNLQFANLGGCNVCCFFLFNCIFKNQSGEMLLVWMVLTLKIHMVMSLQTHINYNCKKEVNKRNKNFTLRFMLCLAQVFVPFMLAFLPSG